jgi:hypothetical protein
MRSKDSRNRNPAVAKKSLEATFSLTGTRDRKSLTDGPAGGGPKIDRLRVLRDTSHMRRLAPFSWAKLMGLLLVMAGLLQQPVRSHEGTGSRGGVDAELVAGSHAMGGFVLALENDGVRVVRPVRPVERSVDPHLGGPDTLLRFGHDPSPPATTVDRNRPPVSYRSPGLVGMVVLRI